MFREKETDIDEKCKNFTAKTPSANTLSDVLNDSNPGIVFRNLLSIRDCTVMSES